MTITHHALNLTVQPTPQPWPCPPYHIKQGPLAQSLSPGHHIRQGCPAPTFPWPLTSDIWWPLMETCSDLFTCGPQLILTSGDHQSMYSWQIGSMHPTIMLSCYYPTTELWKGNVFSHVCLLVCQSTGGGGSHVISTNDALDLIVQSWPWPSRHGTPCWWHLVAITGDLFKLVHLRTPYWYWHLVATEAYTVGKRVVRFLLECFLVNEIDQMQWNE